MSRLGLDLTSTSFLEVWLIEEMELIEEIPHNGSGAVSCNAVVEEQEFVLTIPLGFFKRRDIKPSYLA